MKISVIIPVYNVEKYLRECLDSVINQTYTDLEIICIDDCSTDNSYAILQEYAQKDSRIKVLHNDTNQKVGQTRNRGIEIATGDYIHFLDSDDWMELDAYETLAKQLEERPVDILQFYMQYQKNGISSQDNNLYGLKTTEIYNIIKNSNIIYSWTGYSWSKIYSSIFLKKHNILFNDYPCFEDCIFTLICLLNAQKISFLNKVLYNYRKGDTNTLTANSYKHIDYIFKYFYESQELCKDLNPKLKNQILVWIFTNAYDVCYTFYKKKKISYNTFRCKLKKIDYSIFKNLKHGSLAHSQEVLNYPEFLFILKSTIREIIKKYTPAIHKIILSIKRLK